MAKYIAKRVALALVTLVIVSMLTFFLMFLVPGGPFLSEKSPSPAVLAAMEEKYGLDKPVIVQYKKGNHCGKHRMRYCRSDYGQEQQEQQ